MKFIALCFGYYEIHSSIKRIMGPDEMDPDHSFVYKHCEYAIYRGSLCGELVHYNLGL